MAERVQLARAPRRPCGSAWRSARARSRGRPARAPAPRPAISSSSWRASRRPSVPSSTTYSAISRGDAADHLQALGHRGDVADRHQVLDLQRGQRARDLVEAELVALQGRQRLVGAGQDRGRVLQDAALAVHVQGDQPHRLADRDDREAGLLAHPVGGAVPGAGLLRGDRGVRHQLDAGPQDLGAVRDPGSARRPACTARAAGSRRTRRPARNRRCTWPRRSCRSPARSDRRCCRGGSAPGRRAGRCRARRRSAWRASAALRIRGLVRLRPGRCCHCTPPCVLARPAQSLPAACLRSDTGAFRASP